MCYVYLTRIPADIRDVWRQTSYIKTFKSYHVTACKCMHLVRRGQTSWCDRAGNHMIGSAIPENPMLHANLLALLFLSPELWATEVNFVGIGIFDHFWSCDLDLNPMTFMYKLDPYTWENEKRKVFRSQRKLSKERLGSRRKSGKEFQANGPATDHARQPNIERRYCLYAWWRRVSLV